VLVAPPKFREETSKKAVRLSAVCDPENGLRRCSMQEVFAAAHNIFGSSPDGVMDRSRCTGMGYVYLSVQ
jgi:hypothetical protein